MHRRLLTLLLLSSLASAQDLYDDTIVRTIKLTFHQPDFWSQLKANKTQKIYLEADMEVDGVTYLDVGVRLRGKSSYGTPNKKKPMKIKTDEFVDGQDLWGYDSVRLNNGYFDPSWVREAAMSRLVRDYMPIAKRAYIVLEINGESWGVYVLEQQKDGQWMDENFVSDEGHRYASVTGGAFGWLGWNEGPYSQVYDLQTDQTPNPWVGFIAGADAVNNNPVGSATTDAMLPLVNVDSLLWFIAGDNAFGNNDSYAGNANNWYVVTDDHHGRLEFVNHDLNLAFGTWDGFGPKFEPTHGFNQSTRPLTYRVMQDVDVKREYFAHLRTLNREVLRWDRVGPLVEFYQGLIDAEVQADPKALYTYAEFKGNVTQDIDVGFWVADALRPYVEKRHDYLAQHPLLDREEVVVTDISLLPREVGPPDPILIRAVTTDAVKVKAVELRWRTVGAFTRTAMLDDGVSGDGAAGDGIYAATIPPQAAGACVEYYLVTTAKSGNAKTFHPAKGEWAPYELVVSFGGVGVRVTEYMYTGEGDEYVELTNTSDAPIDLAGWSLDDKSGVAGTFDLSGIGLLTPGASAVVTDGDAIDFKNDWGLGATSVLGDNAVAKLGRNDAVYLFDAAGVVQDRFAYGDEDYPGSPKADGVGAWPCADALGESDPHSWALSAQGDAQGSWTSGQGDLGSPGVFVPSACPGFWDEYCTSTANSTGSAATLTVSGSPVIDDDDLAFFAAPLPSNQFGYLLMSDVQADVPGFGGRQGTLCLGAPILRLVGLAQGTGAGDFLHVQVHLADLPQGQVVLPGETWNFQLWYQDDNPGPTSNTTSAVSMTFE
jgi:hypothetical protein